MTLQWKALQKRDGQRDNYAVRTACDQYTVAKVIVNGRSVFEAWHGRRCIGYVRTPDGRDESSAADEAKKICQSHANGEPLDDHEPNDGV